MTHPVIRAAMLALAASMPLGATAQTGSISFPPGPAARDTRPLTGIRASVAYDLRRYGFGETDVRDLTASQVVAIHHLAHSGQSEGDIRGQISSTLRGGLLQRGLNRLTR